MKKKAVYFIRHDGLSFVVPGEALPKLVSSDHPKFADIILALKNDDTDLAEKHLDLRKLFSAEFSDRIKVENGELKVDGNTLNNSLSDQIVAMLFRDENPGKLIRFLDNLIQNPEQRAILELYNFIKNNNLPITDDGHILAYKVVRKDFYDIFSGTVYYGLGQTVSMPRDDVCADPLKLCSSGLHACSVGYLGGQFSASAENRVLLVKINPAHVVSVPAEYLNTKLRCSQMIGIAEFNVRSNHELKAMDAAILRNLDLFVTSTGLEEKALRELIGMEDKYADLRQFGEFGELMSFIPSDAPDTIKHGHLVGVIMPTENVGDVLERIRRHMHEDGEEKMELVFSDDDIITDPPYEQATSLEPRLVMLCAPGELVDESESDNGIVEEQDELHIAFKYHIHLTKPQSVRRED